MGWLDEEKVMMEIADSNKTRRRGFYNNILGQGRCKIISRPLIELICRVALRAAMLRMLRSHSSNNAAKREERAARMALYLADEMRLLNFTVKNRLKSKFKSPPCA